ncbi:MULTISPECIES: hypothetical protein [unclassified Streptomyces]|uniref:hypothetical protein n=2 Tax=unclassified Streptomyces TaxID=2593676 RepID=UPI00371F28D3
MIKKPAPVLSDCPRRHAPIRTSSEKGIEYLTQVLDARRGSDTTRTWSREDLERSLDLARICVRVGAGG